MKFLPDIFGCAVVLRTTQAFKVTQHMGRAKQRRLERILKEEVYFIFWPLLSISTTAMQLVAGIPRHNLLPWLLWTYAGITDLFSGRVRYPAMYMAPSWSWASTIPKQLDRSKVSRNSAYRSSLWRNNKPVGSYCYVDRVSDG